MFKKNLSGKLTLFLAYLSELETITGRQLRPLSSVLYRIISKRRYILATQLLLREKSGT